jgi:hypothetical protein
MDLSRSIYSHNALLYAKRKWVQIWHTSDP